MAIDVKVPDIGDFKDIPVIEILVKPGDTVKPEDSLVSLESDKATMDVPSPSAGVVKELKVKIGDKVSEGSVILTLEGADVGAGAGAASGGSGATAAGGAGASAAGGGTVQKPASSSAPAASSPATAAAGGGAKAASPSSAAAPAASGSGAAKPASPAPAPAPAPAPVAGPPPASYSGKADVECDMIVIGSGPGGYSAAFRSADLGMKTVLVERYATLGGVCLNVGCIPSKALLHTASVIDEVATMPDHGITYGKPQIDIDKLRAFKDGVVRKLTGGLAGMAKMRKVEVITGYGSFLDPYHVEVEMRDASGKASGAKRVIKFKKAIIAAGSQAVKLPFMPDDPRVVDSTGALLLAGIPKKMLVIGGGIIGLEMATVYSTLGTRIDVVEMLDIMMAGADRDLVKVWEKVNAKRFDNVMLKTKTIGATATKEGIKVRFEGADGNSVAPKDDQLYDLVLVAVGRSPNGKKLGADKAGIAVTDRGFINVDRQLRTNVPHIHAIGDIVGQPMLAHKAVHEAHVAAEAAHGEPSFFDARQIPSVAYTDPEVAWAGKTEDQCKAEGIKYGKAVFPWAASGRAIANGRDEGFTKLLFDEATHRCIGGGIVGTHAGDLIGEVCLAVEMGADPTDIGKTIHPHPTLCESIGMAAELFEGVCTDLPPVKKK